MIVDSSAPVALAWKEPEAPSIREALSAAHSSRLSAATYLEAGIVLDRRGTASLSGVLDSLVDAFDLEIAPVTARQARIAHDAYRTYGRGSGHRAHLNFGDCFSYALAVDADEPLLFKGDDFGHTDVRQALTA